MLQVIIPSLSFEFVSLNDLDNIRNRKNTFITQV